MGVVNQHRGADGRSGAGVGRWWRYRRVRWSGVPARPKVLGQNHPVRFGAGGSLGLRAIDIK